MLGMIIIKPSFSRNEAKWLGIVTLVFSPSLLIDAFWITHLGVTTAAGFYMFLCVLLGVMLANRIDIDKFLGAFVEVVLVLTALSVVLYFLSINYPFGFELRVSV